MAPLKSLVGCGCLSAAALTTSATAFAPPQMWGRGSTIWRKAATRGRGHAAAAAAGSVSGRGGGALACHNPRGRMAMGTDSSRGGVCGVRRRAPWGQGGPAATTTTTTTSTSRRRSSVLIARASSGPFSEESLKEMSYRELQSLAKTHNIKATQKGDALVRELTSLSGGKGNTGEGGGGSGVVKEGGEEWVTFKLSDEEAAEFGLGVDEDDWEGDGNDDDDDGETWEEALAKAKAPGGSLSAPAGESSSSSSSGGGGATSLAELLKLDNTTYDGDDEEEEDEDDDDDDSSSGDQSMGAEMARRLRDARAGKSISDRKEVSAADLERGGFDKVEKLDLAPFKVTIGTNFCSGCGSKFQSANPREPGFLPENKLDEIIAERKAQEQVIDLETFDPMEVDIDLDMDDDLYFEDGEEDVDENGVLLRMPAKEKKTPVCARCYALRHQGSVGMELRPGFGDHETLSAFHFEELLAPLSEKKCVIINIVDLFDFHGSFLENIPRIAGRNHVLLACNKADLFPSDMKPQRVVTWARNEARYMGLEYIENKDIHLISCKTGFGVRSLMRKARDLAAAKRCDIYVVGAANVGKSSFINHLLAEAEEKGSRKGGRASKRKGDKHKPLAKGLTTSNVPGTTLDMLKIDLGEKMNLYDTPGLVLSHQITLKLNTEELKAVIPHKRVEHVTLRVAKGKAVLIGGLARIEVTEGLPFLITFFVSNGIKLHAMDAAKAEDFITKHIGSDLCFPPYSAERLEALGEMVETEFTVDGAGWKESCSDIVLSGLGWVSFTGAGRIRVKIHAPKEVRMMQRDPLLPYEAWDTTSTYSGTKVLKKGKKVQGRRK